MFKHKTKIGASLLAMVTVVALLSGCGADTTKEYDKHLKPETTVSVDKDADKKVDDKKVDDKKDSKESDKKADKADKQDSKESSKTADKADNKKEEKPAENSVAVSKPATNSSGSVSKPSTSKPATSKPTTSKPSGNTGNSSASKPSTSKPAPAPCSHNWKDQYKTVHHDAQYRTEPVYEDKIIYEDRPVYKWQAYWTCNICGQRFNHVEDAGDHVLFECGGGYTAHEEKVQTGTEKVQVGTNKVQVGTKQVLVKEAWDEQVKTGSVCTKCNAHK